MATITVVTTTYNEEAKIAAALESVRWADELVVVDGFSHDRTVEIARQYTPHVFQQPNHPNWNVNKNWGFDRARGDWVLSLDADEEVSAPLRAEIQAILAGDPPHDGYAVPRRNLFLGRWVRHGGLYPDWQLRLFRRGRGRFVERAVHETVEVLGPVGRLRGHLVHRSYESVGDFLERAHRYATLAAADLVRAGARARTRDLVLRPLGRFLAMYVARGGFLDGRKGLLLAALYAYYVFVRTARVWEATRR